jgi:CRISPR/Cas system-associated exonuclease Cas4 (RecB family)
MLCQRLTLAGLLLLKSGEKMFQHKQVQELAELKAITTEVGRVYKTPDGAFPSITTILGRLSRDDINKWRKRVGEETADKISRTSSSRGTRIHKMCEDYINNKKPEIRSPLDKQMFMSMQEILDDFVGEVYGQELPLYSKHLGIAGRVDLICEWNGKLAIVDYKTSAKIKKREWVNSYFMQATAYCIMYEEMTGIPVDRFVILIGVDQEPPQTFYGKRDDNIAGLIDAIKGYYDENDLIHINPALYSGVNP